MTSILDINDFILSYSTLSRGFCVFLCLPQSCFNTTWGQCWSFNRAMGLKVQAWERVTFSKHSCSDTEMPRPRSEDTTSDGTIIPAAYYESVPQTDPRDGHSEKYCSRSTDHYHCPGYPAPPPQLDVFLLCRILMPNLNHTELGREHKSGFFPLSGPQRPGTPEDSWQTR